MLQKTHFRNARNYHLACLTELAAPALRAFSAARCGKPTPAAHWRKGLLLGADHIGDVLYNTASLPYLRRGLPNCEWHYLAETPASQILVNNSCIREVFSPDVSWKTDFRGFTRLARKIASRRFDVAICYDSGAYSSNLLLASVAGIPNRVAYTHKGLSGLATLPVSINYPQPFAAYFRDLVSQLTGIPPTWDLKPRIYETDTDREEAKALWVELGLRSDLPVVVCFVTTRQASGAWPSETFGETLRIVKQQTDAQVVLCGARSDEAILSEINQQFSLSCAINAGCTGLLPLVAFLKRCAVVLTMDSGSRHLANAAGVPVFFLRNLSFSKVEAGKYCTLETDLAPDAEFVSREMLSAYFKRVSPTQTAEEIVRSVKLR